MQEAERLSSLIGEIYDASLAPSSWPTVLASAYRFVGGSAAALYSKDAATKRGRLSYQVGSIDAHYRKLYADRYAKLDPFTTSHFLAEIDQPIATADVMPYDEFRATRFYKEWVLPQGIVDNVTAALDKSGTSVALFTVFRHQRDGRVDDEARRRMRLIVPHLRRAVVIGRVIELKTAEASSFADTLDGIAAGTFLINARGHVIHVNVSGRGMLAEGVPLRLAHGGKLAIGDTHAEDTLHDAFLAAGRGDTAAAAKAFAVPLVGRNGDPYVAHVLPLTSGARSKLATAAVAVLFVLKAALNTTSPAEIVARAFKLTPSELRVLLAIVQIGGVARTADQLGISPGTVKTHLLRVFAKTQTKSQADLVKLVAGYSNPLLG